MTVAAQQLWQHGRGLAERFGLGRVIGCAALGCMVPMFLIPAVLCGVLWWFMPFVGNVLDMTGVSGIFQRVEPTPIPLVGDRATWQPAVTPVPTLAPIYPGRQGVIVQVGPTPVYASATAVPLPGQVEQPAYSDRPMQEYATYQGNTPAEMHLYLAKANLWGSRRTPYSRGQRLTYPDGTQVTVVTGDFDFTLIADQHGQQWYCGPSVNTLSDLANCMFWR